MGTILLPGLAELRDITDCDNPKIVDKVLQTLTIHTKRGEGEAIGEGEWEREKRGRRGSLTCSSSAHGVHGIHAVQSLASGMKVCFCMQRVQLNKRDMYKIYFIFCLFAHSVKRRGTSISEVTYFRLFRSQSSNITQRPLIS